MRAGFVLASTGDDGGTTPEEFPDFVVALRDNDDSPSLCEAVGALHGRADLPAVEEVLLAHFFQRWDTRHVRPGEAAFARMNSWVLKMYKNGIYRNRYIDLAVDFSMVSALPNPRHRRDKIRTCRK